MWSLLVTELHLHKLRERDSENMSTAAWDTFQSQSRPPQQSCCL